MRSLARLHRHAQFKGPRSEQPFRVMCSKKPLANRFLAQEYIDRETLCSFLQL